MRQKLMLHFSDDTLNEYLDEALTPARRMEVEIHLAACAECQTRLAALHAMFTAIESWPDAPLERDLSRAVMAALRPRPASLPPVVRWAFVAQAVLAVVLTSIAGLIFSFTIAPPDSFLSPIFNSLVRSTQSFTAQWQAAWETAQTTLTHEFDSALAVLPQSFEWIWLVGLGAVLALWLAGNGLLLRRFIPAPPPQRSQPS